MKKMIICTAAFAFAFTCAVAGVSVASNHGPAEMTLIDSGKKPAHFPHKAHQDREKCDACHHTKNADGSKGPYVAGKEEKCGTCHNKSMANKKLGSFKNAAHKLCKTCHKAKKAPTKCSTCHPKKK